jgi:hypothetical protein
MARIEKGKPAYPSIERLISETKVVTCSNSDDLDASYRQRVEAFIDAVCKPWFHSERIARQSSAPQAPICTTRL